MTWRSARTIAFTFANTATTECRSSIWTASRSGTWGTAGRGPGQLFNPYALAVDSRCTVSVIDSNNHRVQRFRM